MDNFTTHRARPGSKVFHEQIVISKSRGKVTAIDLGGFQSRNAATLDLIRDAHLAHAIPDYRPITVNTGDMPKGRGKQRIISFSAADGFPDIAAPDFLFDGWPEVGVRSFDSTAQEMSAAGGQPAATPLLGWLGNCDTHPSRWTLHRLATQHPEKMEVTHLNWAGDPAGGGISLPEQVRKFAFLIDVEGRGYSARLKLLLHSGRPVFVQERRWNEYWFRGLQPMRHFVPVRSDLIDLPSRLDWVRQNPDQAEAIGAAGRAFAQENLTRNNAIERWSDVLRHFSASGPGAYAATRHRILGRVRYGLPLR